MSIENKNFKFLENKNLNENKINEFINVLHKNVLNNENNFNGGIEAREIIEIIVEKIIVEKKEKINENSKLIDKWNILKEIYKNEKGSNLPPEINNEFYTIKSWRNNQCHPPYKNDNNAQYKYQWLSHQDKTKLIKTIHWMCQFLIREFIDETLEFINFIDIQYYEDTKWKRHIFDNKIKNGSIVIPYFEKNDDIWLQKWNLAKLILNSEIDFFIPTYQRHYVWNDENCEELFNEIKQNYNLDKKKEIYFGTIAFALAEIDKQSNKSTIRIIDGQQRITTSLLLFRALYDKMKFENIDKMPEELSEFFKPENISKLENKYKNPTSEKIFNEVIEYILTSNDNQDTKKQILETTYKNRGNIINNYLYFLNQVEKMEFNEVKEIFNYFADSFVVSCIDFVIEPKDEIIIFENINSRGRELEVFDLFKSFMFNIVDKDISSKNEEKISKCFNKYLSFENNIDDKKRIGWENDFLFNFCSYKLNKLKINQNLKKNNKKSMLKAVQAIYKNDQNISLEEYEKIIKNDIGKYFKLFSSFIIDETSDKNNLLHQFDFELKNIKHKSDITLLFIFFLIDALFPNKWDNSDNTKDIFLEVDIKIIKECFFEIEKWIISLIQVNGTGQSLSNIILKMISFLSFFNFDNKSHRENIPNFIYNWLSAKDFLIYENNDQKKFQLERDSSIIIPSKEQFRDAIINNKLKDDNISKTLLRRLEKYFISDETKYELNKPTIEHIIPKKLESEQESKLTEPKDFDKNGGHLEYIGRIGNLLLMPQKDNSKAGNKNIEKKQKVWKTNPLATSLLFKNNNDVDICLNDIEARSFDYNDIISRSKAMADILIDKIYYKNKTKH